MTDKDGKRQEKLRTQYPNLAQYAPQTLSAVKSCSYMTSGELKPLERMLYCARIAQGEQPGLGNQVAMRHHCKDVPATYDAVTTEINTRLDWVTFRKGITQEQRVAMKTEVADGWQRARRDGFFAQYQARENLCH